MRYVTNHCISLISLVSLGVLIFQINVQKGVCQPIWQNISGAFPHVGAVNTIARNGSAQLFAGTAAAGILRSTDDGVTWGFANYGLANTTVNYLLATAQGTILAGTSGGVYRSTDGGNSWVQSLSESGSFGRMIQELSRGTIFAIVGRDSLCRSSDEGASWNVIRDLDVNSQIDDIAADSLGNVYVGETWLFGRYTGSSIYLSTDGGSTWDLRSRAILWPTSLANNGVSELLAGTQTHNPSGTPGGIHKSTDRGVTWTRVYTAAAGEGVSNIVSTASGELLASEGNLLLRSSNNGASWSRETSRLIAARIRAVEMGSGIKLLGTQSGEIFSSSNNGYDWVKTFGGIPDTIVTAIDVGPNRLLLAACTRGGFGGLGESYLCKSTNGGMNWTVIYVGYSAFSDLHLASNGNYFALGDGGIRRSTDAGVTWLRSTDVGTAGATSIFENRQGDLLMSSPPQPPLWSRDSGASWQFFPGWGPPGPSIIQLRQGNIIASGNGSIQISADTGRTWRYIRYCEGQVSSFTADSLNRVFAGIHTGDSAGILRSSDSGISWTRVLLGHQVTSLVTNRNGFIFAGTTGNGVIRSTNSGATWSSFNDQAINMTIKSLAIDLSGFLHAGTNNGLFKTIGSTTSVEEDKHQRPTAFSLSQNYPNPFNPTTNIRYQTASREFVELKLYDLLGRQVTTLVNEVKEPGTYTVNWDARLRSPNFGGQASELSTGVYFYRLKAGSFSQTKKLVLVR